MNPFYADYGNTAGLTDLVCTEKVCFTPAVRRS